MTTLFTSDHEWLQIDGDVATIGITDYAQTQLGDVVFVELPKVGRTFKKAEAAAVVESVKAASDVYATIAGGGTVTPTPSCSGADRANAFVKDLGSIPARPRGSSSCASPTRATSTA
jgi:hypothetical protein